jgi:hypothetical protein
MDPKDLPFDPLTFEMTGTEGEVAPIEEDISTISNDELDFTDEEKPLPEPEFADNLAEWIDPEELGKLASELIELYRDDRGTRKEWANAYRKGLDLLGFKFEERTTPFSGACGITHPIMSEAVTRFTSQAIMEICPASGPVKTKIIGDPTPEKDQKAKKIRNDMNHLLMDVMKEYRPETERKLFHLALAGSAFKKVYFDQIKNRPACIFVPAEDLIVSYDTTDLDSAGRYTHVMRKPTNEVRKLMWSGFYSKMDMVDAPPEETEVKEAQDKLDGLEPPQTTNTRILLEMHCELDLPGFEDEIDGELTGIELPYVVTIDLDSEKILSIRRNWLDGDETKKKVAHFVHYLYQPGLGFYGLGLIHLIGGITKGATSMLRQLVDAGTLSNLPAGFKTRGLRIKSDDKPIEPGEWRDVDVPGATLKDNLMPLPYKEPSATLAALLGTVVEEGRRFASINDLPVGQGNQEAPVGTTLALLERALKVMSAIHARLHASQKREFEILKRVIQESYNDIDFDDSVEIIPVSDPNATSFAQRVLAMQTALQISQTAPQVYDMAELHRSMLTEIGMEGVDRVIPDPSKVAPIDPASENANAITGRPLKAFAHQNHQAHIAAHSTMLQDPSIQQNPLGQNIMAQLQAHINEHIAYDYKNRISQMIGMPIGDQPLPPQVEAQASIAIAQAAAQITGQHQQEEAAKQAMQNMQDPVIQAQMLDAQTKAAEVERKQEKDLKDYDVEVKKLQVKNRIDNKKIDMQKKIADAKIAADLIKNSKQSADKKASDERNFQLRSGTKK